MVPINHIWVAEIIALSDSVRLTHSLSEATSGTRLDVTW